MFLLPRFSELQAKTSNLLHKIGYFKNKTIAFWASSKDYLRGEKSFREFIKGRGYNYIVTVALNLALVATILFRNLLPATHLIIPVISASTVRPLTSSQTKDGYEVMGFAPYFTFDKLDSVDFSDLTTFAYFGIDVDGDGNLVKSGQGYDTFMSDKATQIFQKAHNNGTRVVLTITQMDADQILALMDNPDAQHQAISQTVDMVKSRGLDGVNVDMEYGTDPGQYYRDRFSQFITQLTEQMHQALPNSRVTVSVYASAVKDPKIYDVSALGKNADGIFMMAYDFAVAGSDNAVPTAPLYGYKQGKYWYDVSTAVDDFLKLMPANKLILGVPYYGYNYLVYEPGVNAATRPYWTWRGTPTAQTYSYIQDQVQSEQQGWDNYGEVGYKAYYDSYNGTWRMVFEEDAKSLGIKYDFAKSKNLAGVGIWALGFDDGKQELWNLLSEKFGGQLSADAGGGVNR